MQLGELSDSELMSLHREVGRELNKMITKASKKRDLLTRIKSEIGSRSEERRKTGGFLISDHAIVRYLERHTDLDVEAIRVKIFEMAKAGKEIDDTDRVKSGPAVFAIDRASGTIATIMNQDENDLVSG